MNAPIKPINAAHEALLNSDDALCVDAVAAATGMKKRYAAKQIKQLAGLGLIEPEFRAGGVPFYRLIAAPASEINDVAEVGDTNVVVLGDSEGGEADAPAAFTEAQREEFTLLGVIADIRKAIGDEGRIMLGDLVGEIGNIVEARNDFFAEAVQIALQRLKDVAALQSERDDLRARLDAVTQQSIADTDVLTQQIEHLRAELETARAEAIALKTLEGAMPGFGAEYDAQRIASLTAELQALRTSNANAINEADRLRAELATERQAREALQEQESSERALSGYIVRSAKRKPKTIKTLGKAHDAAMSAIRAGAMRADVFALVPVGTARRGAEWRAK